MSLMMPKRPTTDASRILTATVALLCVTGAAESALAAAAAASSNAKGGAVATPGAPSSDADKTLYALGVLISRNLETFSLSAAELKIVEQGITDGSNHHPALDADAYQPQVQTLQRTRLGAIDEKQKAAGQAYLDKAAAQPGAQKTATGMVFIPLTEGKGATPDRTDRVSVQYEGKLTDGTVFDSSAKHGGQPVQLSVGGIIPCWTEALQLMKVGGKARVVCPSTLAYGDRGSPPTIMPGSTLDFTVELVDILPKQAAPAAPGSGTGSAVPPPKPSN
jgi:FKBP-type peptidyl-prolyl cis-trans isomerase FkpA/FKBP-type peptidyl-prolyl cis-trans isomerase FklB